MLNHPAPVLETIVDQALPLLSAIPADTFSAKPDANRWSQKEIVGHLIDSALNNHRRQVSPSAEFEWFLGYERGSDVFRELRLLQ